MKLLRLFLWFWAFALKAYAAEFSEMQTFHCGGKPLVGALADLNGDGFGDLIVGTYPSGVAVYLNSKVGRFSTKPAQFLQLYASGFAPGDFNGDGTNDLAIAEGGAIFILHGNGDGTFRTIEQLNPELFGPVGTVLAADLNGDGYLDLISVRPDRAEMRLILNNAGKGFLPPHAVPIPLNASLAIRNEAKSGIELLVATVAPPEINIWRDISGNWQVQKRIQLPRFDPGRGGAVCTMDVGDADGDGIQDLMITKDGVAKLSFLSGENTGGFESCVSVPSPLPIRGAALLRSKERPASVAYGFASVWLREGSPANPRDWKRVADLSAGGLIKAEEQPDGNRSIVAVDFYGFVHVLSTRLNDPPDPVTPVFEYYDPRYDPMRAPSFSGRTWSAADGLPGNSVRSILQTSDGYVWIGTTEGLVRFDGETFRRWGVNSNGTVFNRSCEALAEDPKGRLWVGYLRGLMRIEGNSIAENYVTNLTDPRIFSLQFSNEGDLWIAEFNGLDRLRNGVFESIGHPETPGGRPFVGSSMSLAHSVTGNRMILGTYDGIFAYDASEKVVQGKWLHGPLDFSEPEVVLDGLDGEIFTGDKQCGVAAVSSNSFRVYYPKWGPSPGDGPGRITGLARGRDNSLWIGTLGGLFVLRNGEVARVSDTPALRNTITALCIDHDGNLWVGTDEYGVVLLRFPLVDVFTTRNGLSSDRVISVAQDGNKTLWIATVAGVCTNFSGTFRQFVLPPIVPQRTFSAICLRQNGEAWFGGDSGQHYILNTTGFISETDFGHLDHVAFTELKDGRMLMVSDAGVNWRDTNSGSSIGTTISPPGSARNVFEDSKGGIWMGSLDGISLYDPKTRRGIPVRDKSLTGRCEVTLEDSRGALWIISDQGLVRLKDGRCSPIRLNAGLFDENLLSMVDDHLGNYWFGSGHGIFRVESAQLNRYADGKLDRVECIHYGIGDGMLSDQCAYGHPSACRSQDGNLWFGTANGLVKIDPSQILRSSGIPPIFFDEISDDSGVLLSRFAPRNKENAAYKLPIKPGNERSLTFQFSSPTFSIRGAHLFEYRLAGLENKWTKSEHGKASYNYLPPGDYSFEVRAANSSGLWSPALSVPIQIAPLLTQRRDFYFVSGTLGIGLLALFTGYRRRTQLQIHALRQRAAIAEERSRIARDLHDDIGGSLTQIAMASDLARSQLSTLNGAEKQIEKVSQLARGAVENMSQIIWSTNPKFDTLASLIAYLREFASKFLPESIELQFEAFETGEKIHVSSEFRRNFFYIMKEALANILKHSGATIVTIKLQDERDNLQLLIIDNGKGFIQNERMLLSTGLDSMKKRVANLHGKIEIISAQGKGTIVTASFPLREHTVKTPPVPRK